MEYMTLTRIQKALSLLRSTSISVSIIANRCGYTTDAYFCRAFKKSMGVTPGEYRDKNLSH